MKKTLSGFKFHTLGLGIENENEYYCMREFYMDEYEDPLLAKPTRGRLRNCKKFCIGRKWII